MATKVPKRISDVLREFRITYADSLLPDDYSEADLQVALKTRRLNWKATNRLTLLKAADCYAQIPDSYNEFRPELIADLHAAFASDEIMVTVAREFSVAIYLHVPDYLKNRVEEFVRANLKADSVKWTDGTLRVWWD